MPSRSGWPGATRARASAMAELGRTTTSAWYPAHRCRLDAERRASSWRITEVRSASAIPWPTPRPGPATARAGPPCPGGPSGHELGDERVAEPDACRLGQPARRRGAPAGSRRPDPPRRRPPGRAGRGRSATAEASARARARSAAGSSTRMPPTAEAKTSVRDQRHPGPLLEHRQQQRQAAAVHTLGRAPARASRGAVRAVRAWTSTSRARWPCMAGSTALPGAPGRRSPEQQLVGVGHRGQPGVVHLEQPELAGGAEAVLGGAHRAQGVVAVPLDAEDGVDEVLQRARAGQGPLLGDVAHEHEGHPLELGQVHDEVGAGPHLAEAARGARRRRGRPRPGSSPRRRAPAPCRARASGSDREVRRCRGP